MRTSKGTLRDEPQPHAALMESLLACGKRGRWKIALQLLDDIAAEGPVPTAAWLSAVMACRKQKRVEEQLSLLDRMGGQITTAACNEVLHTLRIRREYTRALQVWRERLLPPHGSAEEGEVVDEVEGEAGRHKVNANGLSYYHMLHICGEDGRSDDALLWLEEMQQAGESVLNIHYHAVLKGLASEREWVKLTQLARKIPQSILQARFRVEVPGALSSPFPLSQSHPFFLLHQHHLHSLP